MIRRKKLSGSSFIAALAFVFAAFGFSYGQDQPWDPNVSPLGPSTGFVNDYVGVIDAATKQQLEDKLTAFKQKTTVEIAVAVVRTTGEREIFDYSLAVARGWKIGSDRDDNPGALLFVAIDDRKYFTQISRDLEDELPDALAGNLQRQYLIPEFRNGNYSKGISDTIDAYIRTIEQRASGVATPTPVSSGGFPSFRLICCLIIIFMIFLIILANRGGGGKSRRDNDRWGGGFGGGGGALPWIIGSAISNAASSSSSSWGGSSDWGGSSGGWGGFGGGGDFGGGGSGGSW
jgi:uncharacterized protein